MTKKEFKKLVEEYTVAHKLYYEYLEHFFTSYLNGELINKVDKFLTGEEESKIKELENKYKNLEDECYKIILSNNKLTD